MDLSQVPNPYDFANPVDQPDLFIGRHAEMSDIRYYLDHASKASRPINLAIIGPRASGKTSVLNMTEMEAKKRGFCVARVDLDEADAETQLAFFYKVFDSVLMAAFENGTYGGLTGRTHETYRDMVDAHEIPADREFCSFTFPFQYAKAMGKGNSGAIVSDSGLKRDMASVQKELAQPVALLFDECDVLTKSRALLQKLRNVFMHTPGFMIVFAGMPSLFPLIDEVFSPIIRQFKKIDIGPFRDEREIRDCMLKPLEKIGKERPRDMFDYETYYDVHKLHGLSGGRPYEIQLICHFMFRRVHDGRSQRMRLSVEVLDDVLREMETWQDVKKRRVITAVKGFEKPRFQALSVLCSCSGNATLEQIWFDEYVFRAGSRWTREALEEELGGLQEMDIIVVRDGIVSFNGDDFDRVYCKYLAQAHGMRLSVNELPYDFLLDIHLQTHLREKANGGWTFPMAALPRTEREDLEKVVAKLRHSSACGDPFEEHPGVAEIIYRSISNCRQAESFKLAEVRLVTPWVEVRQWYGGHGPKPSRGYSVEGIGDLLAEPRERARELGGDLTVVTHEFPVVPLEALANRVEHTANPRTRRHLSDMHMVELVEAHTERHDMEEALSHGELAYRYAASPAVANNFGYLLMVADDLKRARNLLQQAVEGYEVPGKAALPNYNLGVVEGKEGRLDCALAKFRLAAEQAQTVDSEERKCECLIVPVLDEETSGLRFDEIKGPDLLETARAAVSTTEKLIEGK